MSALRLFDRQAVKDDGRIVVCCRGGESRSPAIVLAYLIQVKKATYDAMFADVEAACPGLSPNGHWAC